MSGPERTPPPPATEPDDHEGGAAVVELDAARRERIERLAAEQQEFFEARAVAQQRARSAEEIVNGRAVRFVPASSFAMHKVRWGWERRMPVGEITLIPGREGAGKSTLLAWMAAQLTRGTLPGEWHGTPRAVLYVATEDSWSYTIAPRMVAAGADLDLVYRLDVEVHDGGFAKLSLPLDTSLLGEAADHTGAAALMLDPAISVISDKINTFKAQELRGALEPLKRALEDTGMICAGLVHFSKAKDVDALTAVSGSRAWTEMARAVIAVARDKDLEEANGRYTCVVSQVKNNLGRLDLPNETFTIESVEVDTEDGVAEVGRLRWTGESDRSAEDVLSTPKKGDKDKTGEATRNVVEWVLASYGESGHGVQARAVVDAFSSKIRRDTVNKILQRSVTRGELRRIEHGLYIPGDPEVMPCNTPNCDNNAEIGRPFCRPCADELDRADRATRVHQDPLYTDGE